MFGFLARRGVTEWLKSQGVDPEVATVGGFIVGTIVGIATADVVSAAVEGIALAGDVATAVADGASQAADSLLHPQPLTALSTDSQGSDVLPMIL